MPLVGLSRRRRTFDTMAEEYRAKREAGLDWCPRCQGYVVPKMEYRVDKYGRIYRWSDCPDCGQFISSSLA